MAAIAAAPMPLPKIGNFIELDGLNKPWLVRVSDIVLIYASKFEAEYEHSEIGTRVVLRGGQTLWTPLEYVEVALAVRGGEYVS